MKKHTIVVAILLSFFTTLVYAYSNVPKENGKENYDTKSEPTFYLVNEESSDILNDKATDKNIIPLDDAEIAKEKPAKKKIYKVWVTLKNPHVRVEGYLYEIQDSSLVVSSTMEELEDQSSFKLSNTIVPVANIDKIKLKRKGSVGKGYLIGTSIGIGTGIILGSIGAEGDGFTIFAVAGTLGIVGSIIGTGIGQITGTRVYYVSGNQESFNVIKPKLKKFSIVNE